MTVFNFTLLVNDPLADVVSAALGVDADNGYVENDIGKGVKLAAGNNYVPVGKDDEIEGVVAALNPETVNDGFSFGSVQKNRRIEAMVGANVSVTPVAVGTLVVADTPVALGTAGMLQVYVGAPALHKWRVIRNIVSAAAAGATIGDTVLLERV
jgi:hypothetical protein